MPETHDFPSTETVSSTGWITLDLGDVPMDVVSEGVLTLTNLATDAQLSYPIFAMMRPCLALEAGLYRVALHAMGREPYRGLVEVAPGTAVAVKLELPRQAANPPTLPDILRQLEVPNPNVEPRDITVPEGRTVELSSDLDVFRPDWQQITLADLDAAKRTIGIDNDTWGVDAPRYGMVTHEGVPPPDGSIERLAKEYIYGNSATVSAWKEYINAQVFKERWTFTVFVYGTVTISRGGMLRITDRSSFFTCQKLRMHISSTLEVRGTGPGVIWPASYESFC
jgi:hypothetical protein